MPPAARLTDMHVCPMVEPGPVPHVRWTDILSGSTNRDDRWTSGSSGWRPVYLQRAT